MSASKNIESNTTKVVHHETLITPPQMKCIEFVEHYLTCFNASESARRMGYKGASAASQGWEFLHDDFTQAELDKRYKQHAHENHHARNEIIAMLYREANYFGEGSSHAARVRAQTQLSKIFGMETLKIEAETKQTGGVMIVPMCQSVDEWEKIVAPKQMKLMDDTVNYG